WVCYVTVPNLERAVEQAKDGRGSLLLGPQDVPGGERIAQLMDPHGAFFALHWSRVRLAQRQRRSPLRRRRRPPRSRRRKRRKRSRRKSQRKLARRRPRRKRPSRRRKAAVRNAASAA